MATPARNPMPTVVRAVNEWCANHTKQPGRRYGPEPRSTISGQGLPKGRRLALKAAKSARREAAGATPRP